MYKVANWTCGHLLNVYMLCIPTWFSLQQKQDIVGYVPVRTIQPVLRFPNNLIHVCKCFYQTLPHDTHIYCGVCFWVQQLIRPVFFPLQTVVVQASYVQPLEDFHLDRLHGRGRGGQDHHCLPGLVRGHHLPHHRGVSQHLSLRTVAGGMSL